MQCNIPSNIHGTIKKNNQNKGNILRNPKNISKISIINNNANISMSSKKKIEIKNQRKMINDKK